MKVTKLEFHSISFEPNTSTLLKQTKGVFPTVRGNRGGLSSSTAARVSIESQLSLLRAHSALRTQDESNDDQAFDDDQPFDDDQAFDESGDNNSSSHKGALI